jgi:hypothetical protein
MRRARPPRKFNYTDETARRERPDEPQTFAAAIGASRSRPHQASQSRDPTIMTTASARTPIAGSSHRGYGIRLRTRAGRSTYAPGRTTVSIVAISVCSADWSGWQQGPHAPAGGRRIGPSRGERGARRGQGRARGARGRRQEIPQNDTVRAGETFASVNVG